MVLQQLKSSHQQLLNKKVKASGKYAGSFFVLLKFLELPIICYKLSNKKLS